jgi:TRAP transporter TAXI family solute receptor
LIQPILASVRPLRGHGDTVAEIVNRTDPSLLLETRNTKGSTENIPLLEAGSLDIALVAGEPAYEALMGVGRPRTVLKIVAAMYSTPGMFAVRGDSPARAIRDLVGKPVAFGTRGSGLVILSRYVLDGLGLDQDNDFQAIYLDRAGDGPAMVLDGRAAALWGGGTGWPGFTAVAQTGGRFLAPEPEELAGIRAKHPFLKPLTVPAGSYPGQSAEIRSVGSWSFWRAQRSRTMSRIGWRARSTAPRTRSARSFRRRARRPPQTRSPRRRIPISFTLVCCAICARSR